jgi:tRNA A37 N6-isopentenylltransferase MiaA
MITTAAPYQPYYLMNHYESTVPVSAQQYAQDARNVIKDILARNKTPIIEGGSPFYIN